jgi:aspartyl-tRNA(Asn)/glutamyl-tRNA(Gln) amidotransferase subunit A
VINGDGQRSWSRGSLVELLDSLEAGDISSHELASEVIDRIEATQATLNSFTALRDPELVLAEARDADARRKRGEARPLEGVPLGVKDLEDVADMVTSKGSVPFRDNVAETDSVQVARLRAAGAIVVGKTNTPEFGYTALTKNLLFGTTRNPWNLERTPGGSSGGSSAAVAGGVVPLATASDGGGSIRIPASCTGLFGLKGSYGRVPKGPNEHWDIDQTSVYGPLTRTVEDAALLLDLTCGPHPLDPYSLPAPTTSYRETLWGLPSGLRIAWSLDLGYAAVQSDVGEVSERAARVFEELGHGIEVIEEGPPEPGRDWGLLGALEQLSKLTGLLPEHEEEFGRSYLRGVKTGVKLTPERWGTYRRRREELNRWCARLFDRYDLLLTPTIPYDPPAAGGPLLAEVEGRRQPAANIGSFTMPFNLSWHPAASVRAGLSQAGLPVGLQIVAPRHRDDLVLQAAFAFQQARPWHPHWPEAYGS